MRVTDNADDLRRRLIHTAHQKAPADWVFFSGITGPKMTCQVFTDDRDPLLAFAIVLREHPPSFQGNAKRLKVVGRNNENRGYRSLVQRQRQFIRLLHRCPGKAHHRQGQ